MRIKDIFTLTPTRDAKKGKSNFVIEILIIINMLALSACSEPFAFSKLTTGNCTKSQQLLIQNHISGQIDAIADKNWQKAYTFAAKSFQEVVSLERFTRIISEQYVLLITNKGYTFDSCEIENERLVQKITVIGANDDFRMTYRLSVEDKKLGVVAAAVTDVSEDVAT
ncbi:MAG: DUF4864 domain-containing protein [Candidatus Nanopelagicus sp.]